MKKIIQSAKNLLIIKRFFKEAPWFFGRHAFWVILFFIFLSVIFGIFLFYGYVIEPKGKELKIQEDLLIFKESVYQNIMEQWGAVDQESINLGGKNYSNPFKKE